MWLEFIYILTFLLFLLIPTPKFAALMYRLQVVVEALGTHQLVMINAACADLSSVRFRIVIFFFRLTVFVLKLDRIHFLDLFGAIIDT